MVIFFVPFLVLCCFACPAASNHFNRNNGIPGHLLMAPSSFSIGISNKICLSRFGSSTLGSATAQVELLSLPLNNFQNASVRHVHKVIARTRKIFPNGHGECMELYVPKTIHRKALLHFKMRFESLPNYKVNSKKIVKIQHDTNIIIIQTDKPMYRGGEIVKLRVLQLKTDLTPQYSPIYRVFIEAPSDIFGAPVKIAQWFNVTSRIGYMQREYQLDKYAKKGEWRIVVDSRDPSVASTVKTFHVTEYKLAKFYISVGYQENVVRTFRQLLWNICAKHIYGEVVAGSLHINVKSDSYGYSNINFSTELKENNKCYNYTLRTKLLGFQEKNQNKPTRVVADIAFQEAHSKIWKNVTAITYIQESAVKIEFVNKHDTHFKPSLPHKFKVKVTDWDGNGVSNAKIKFCKNMNETFESIFQDIVRNSSNGHELIDLLEDCDLMKSNNEGFASFAYTIPSNLEYIYLNVIVIDHPLEDFESQVIKNNFASDFLKLYSWGNKTRVNMAIGSPISNTTKLRNNERYTFPVFLKFDNDNIIRQITLHYLIVTRFGTIYSWGISTQCINPMHDVQNIESVFGPTIFKNGCFDTNLSETGIYKMMLNVQITHLMCPYSHLIAYFIQPNGEIIVANKIFKGDECFTNKLTQEWIPKTAKPFSKVKLHINSVGPALCMLGVKNVAFNLIAPKYSVYNDIINKITHFMDLRNNQTISDISLNTCFTDQLSDKYSEIDRTYFWNTLKTFLATGLEVLTDVLPQVEKCVKNGNVIEKPAEISYSQFSKAPKERVHFPETWLWDIQIMNSSGILDIETTVPDDITKWESEVYCVTRSGVAAAVPDETAVLKVFQPFFIEISAPKVIKRSEHVQMFYKIYNYMDQKLPVVFDIEVAPTAAVSITSHEGAVNRVSCIPKKKSLTNHFTIKAHQLRSINITITAHVKSNMQKLCSLTSPPSISQDIRDTIVKEIQVEPEGIPIENHKSSLLCINDLSNKTEVSWVFNRKNCVDQSENWFILLVGDITGPMALNVDKLVNIPMGCGEQNMVLLAYNLIALEYSVLKKRTSGEMKDRAINNLLTGYQRQLNFQHSDTGAFSAFGNADEFGSTWLTAFCIKYLSILRNKWNIGTDDAINKTSLWLLNRQMENGCFSNEGQVFHREMRGGLENEKSSIALTAYVIISILDGDVPNLKPLTIQDASYCLAALKFDDLLSDQSIDLKNHSMYTYALATLAQIKIEKYLNMNHINIKQFINQDVSLSNVNTTEKKYKFLAGGASNAVVILKKMAKRNGEFLWWEASSLSTSIETTGYAMLSLLAVGGDKNVMDAISAAKWLSLYRNANGGFISTQDTLVAIEALCTLRQAMPDVPPSMNVIVEGPGRARHFTVNPSEKHKLHIVSMKSIDVNSKSPTKLKIKAQGKGCLLVQATQRYNQHSESGGLKSSFDLYVKTSTDGTFDCTSNNSWCMCAAILEVCVSWNDPTGKDFPEMAILQIQMPTGYSPDRHLLYQLINRENILLRRIEESKNEDYIYVYLSATLKTTSFRPNECFKIYLMGSQGYTLPATLKIYDYYHTEISETKAFMIPEDCPFEWQRSSHEEPADILENFDVTKQTDQHWHVIDSDTDLDIPKAIEGVRPIYKLPPSDFNYTKAIITQDPPFNNWTMMNSEMDLDFPTSEEGNEEVWDIL